MSKGGPILVGKVWVSFSQLDYLQPESEFDYWCTYPEGSAVFESADLAPLLFSEDRDE
mgnify:CR=1 FL=1